ncbi:hypothetical protein ACH5Y9_01125 [Methylomonas sp. BW4-1]|uniref:hypothetical protein n=1 Tax=Methylomonas sp. BW4-1 TaxID=3376685 RepID=UPI00404197D8
MEQYQQLSFADVEYANKGKVTRREKFLNQLDGLLPWSVMRAVIEPHYDSGKGCGRKPFALNAMLHVHVHVAQIVYSYSDPGIPKGAVRD